jgi:hypothetical protein
MKRVLILTAIAASIGASSSSAAIILCYAGNAACPDEISWTNQLNLLSHPITATETFTGSLLSSTGVSQVGGIHGWVEVNGVWHDSVINNAGATWPNQPHQTTTFWYQDGGSSPIGVWGFGANFDTSPGQGGHASGVTLILNVGGAIFNVSGFTGGFFGAYVTTAPEKFSTLTLDTQESCNDGLPHCTGWEIFNMDNLRFALDGDPQIQHMPEPATFAMLGVALAGMGAIRLRRKA